MRALYKFGLSGRDSERHAVFHSTLEMDPQVVVTEDATNDEIETKKVPTSCGCDKKCCTGFLRRNLLLFLLLLSLAVGISMGIGLRFLDVPFTDRQLMYFRFPGDLLMRMLKALVVPLIVSSLVSGLAGMDMKASGRMGLYSIIYYMTTTFSAVLLGILLVCTIRPGQNASAEVKGSAEPGNIVDSFLDLLRNIFPDNIVEATFRQTKTYQVPMQDLYNQTELINATDDRCYNMTTYDGFCNYTSEEKRVWYGFSIRKEDGVNALGLVVFSLALGVAVGRLGDVGKPLYHVCLALAEATMCLVTAVIWYSPIGIMFLVASEVAAMKDAVAQLQALGLYMVTVLTGLAIHGAIILPLIYLLVVRKNPFKYLLGTLQALLTAFGTASSSATLPVTYYCLEENNKVDRRVTRFILPVGATINMDGTALYEAVAAIYIAQSNGMQLDAAQIIAISITATLASIGAASVPQAGLVTMVIVLSAIGLPAEEVTKILAVDWLLDRFRTAVNVEGDSIGAGIVYHLCRDRLEMKSEDPDDHSIDRPTISSSSSSSCPTDASQPPSYKAGHPADPMSSFPVTAVAVHKNGVSNVGYNISEYEDLSERDTEMSSVL